jgi:glycosyltransferase involved in cell wall biosynthesis
MSQKRKVLMLSCGYKEGNGVATVTRELTETLNGRGDYEVDVLTYWPWGSSQPFQFISHDGKEEGFSTLEEFLGIPEANQQYDVLQFHNNIFTDTYLELSGSRLESLLEQQRDAVRVSLTHSLASKSGSPEQVKTEKEMMDISDVLVHLTEDQLEEANEHHPDFRSKTTVVGNGTNIPLSISASEKAAFRRTLARDDQKIGLYLGRLSEEKGINELIESMPFIKAAHPEFKLIIAGNKGDTAEQWAREQLGAYGYTEGIDYQFMGWVTDRKTKQLLTEAADMTIMPSHYEHFPMSALESMIVGTPLVITDIPGPRSVFKLRDEKQRLALTIREVGSSHSIAEAVNYALENPEEMRTIATRAQRTVIDNYTWDMIAEEYDELFGREIAKKNGTTYTPKPARRKTTGEKKRIGVVIPTYNRKELLDANLSSLLNQDYQGDYVVVLVDDGSTDGTFEHVIKNYQAYLRTAEDQTTGQVVAGNPNGKLIVIRQNNKHISGARNTGFRRLHELGCEYFTHQDSDDVALPNKLRILSERLDQDPRLGLVHAKSHTATYEGVLLTPQESPWERYYGGAWADFGSGVESMWDRARRNGWERGQLERDNYIHNHTPMYTREAIERLGLDNLYPEGVKFAEDHEFHKKLERAGVLFGFVDDYVAISRWHNAGLTGATDRRTPEEILAGAREETDLLQKGIAYTTARNRARGFSNISGLTLQEISEVEFDLAFNRNYHRNVGDQRTALLYANVLAQLSQNSGHQEEAQSLRDEASFTFAFERDYFANLGQRENAVLRAKQAYMLSPSSENQTRLSHLLN